MGEVDAEKGKGRRGTGGGRAHSMQECSGVARAVTERVPTFYSQEDDGTRTGVRVRSMCVSVVHDVLVCVVVVVAFNGVVRFVRP